jgi:RHS repeat-associated protein
MYFVQTDYFGSILAITDESGSVTQRFSYDACLSRSEFRGREGRPRNPNDWTDYTVADHWLKRGFTGHEHLSAFGLINMNGRLYDPMLGRMLSPDNYVQASDYTQSFNRYSYCLNNPLKYTDPSGNFITGLPLLDMSLWTIAGAVAPVASTFFDPVSNASNSYIAGFVQGNGSFKERTAEGNRRLGNSLALVETALYTDHDATFFEQAGQLKGRFSSWESPHTLLGYGIANFHNTLGEVESVNNFHGAAHVEMNANWIGGNFTTAYTVGPYIMGNLNITDLEYELNGNLTPRSSILIHEYGHYLQGRAWGTFGYVPGAINSVIHNGEDDDQRAWSERDASRRSLEYMNSHGINTTGYRWGGDPNDLPRETVNLWWLTVLIYGGLIIY